MSEDKLWAVKNGDLEQLQEIFSKSPCDPNAVHASRTLLHHAADYGQIEIIEFLISKGANVNVKDENGVTPLLFAIYENHIDCVRLLLAKGADKSCRTADGKSYADEAESEEIKKLLA